ncbi:hypothetical protein SAMN05421636_10360 [Pricia antarctica]|uniref:Uncharacterized protein n=1 Tax=Pricia antarctica TaxID=641691 RepID=A0A1G6ZRP3_9FLAO|nr:DUF6747 family protein [Pricia antarctica]SDE05053.1 hypothetical protein SAMN05421636_10360 [Pricia antarctica]
MGTLSHFRTIYIQAFKGCKPEILVVLLKVYSVFCALMLFLAVYAFMDRALNGFDF